MATQAGIIALRISTDRGAWLATVHGVTNSQTQLTDKAHVYAHTHTHTHTHTYTDGLYPQGGSGLVLGLIEIVCITISSCLLSALC